MLFKATCNPIRMKPVRYAMKQWRRKLFINTWRHIKKTQLSKENTEQIYSTPPRRGPKPKDPSSLSAKTKQKYAKQIKDEYKEKNDQFVESNQTLQQL